MTDAVKVYFDTNVFLDKFKDRYNVQSETNNIFNKVKSGEFRLIISQSILMEIYHVLCLSLEENISLNVAQNTLTEITSLYNDIKKTMLQFPNTEFTEDEFNELNSTNLIDFVESVPGSSLIDFKGKKLPGSMDFMHIVIASNLKCKKFFTYDKGVLLLKSNQRTNGMDIIRPYLP